MMDLDNTYKIISKFKDKRIKVFRNTKNLGLGPSRIKAQKKLKGDYIAILDSDNIFMKSNKIPTYVLNTFLY